MIARDQLDHSGDPSTVVRDYILQNWRADVIALVAPGTYDDGTLVEAGRLRERISYDPYGIPFASHPTDLTVGATGGVAGYGTPSGVVDSNDYSYFLNLYSGSNFRADWNKDGTLSAADSTAFVADHGAASGTWGRGVLSNRGNILGYAGYVHEPATGEAGGGHGTMWHVRHRVMHSGLGRWVQTDPLEYSDSTSLVLYGTADPIGYRDCSGLFSCAIADAPFAPGTPGTWPNYIFNGAHVVRTNPPQRSGCDECLQSQNGFAMQSNWANELHLHLMTSHSVYCPPGFKCHLTGPSTCTDHTFTQTITTTIFCGGGLSIPGLINISRPYSCLVRVGFTVSYSTCVTHGTCVKDVFSAPPAIVEE